MSKILILAEKPSLAKEIANAIGSGYKRNSGGFFENDKYIVANLVGHVLERKIPKQKWEIEKLPLSLELNSLKLIPKSDKKKLVKDLVENIQRNDVSEIVSAGDADQEGSLLIQEILEYGKAYTLKKPITRMWILAMDKKTLSKAFDDRFDISKDQPYIDAAESRTYADSAVGLNFTQLYTLKYAPFKTTYSIGRVQTPTLSLIRKREIEIDNFEPVVFHTIKGTFSSPLIENTFLADCLVEDEKGARTTRIKDSQIKDEKEKTKDKNYKVLDKKVDKKSVRPDYLPNLNDILKNISKIYKMKAKAITEDIQVLYELKLISYPRSENRFLPTAMENDIKSILTKVNNNHDVKFDVKNKRIFKDTDESHFAIIPLKELGSEKITDNQKKIYEYIKAKFIMAFMNPYEYESTIITLKNSKNSLFKLQGQIEIKKGYREYDSILNKSKNDIILPKLEKEDEVYLEKIQVKKDATKPPSLLKEPELLAFMENIHSIYKKEAEVQDDREEEIFDETFSLGTPATRGGIIELLFKRNFIKSDSKGFLTTTKDGQNIYNLIEKDISLQLTADFEKKMNLIRENKLSKDKFNSEIDDFVLNVIEKQKGKESWNKKTSIIEETGENCPECGKPLVKRDSKFGKFVACSGYPECKYKPESEDNETEDGFYEKDKLYELIKDSKKYVIWKNSIGRYFKKDEANELFEGQTLEFDDFKSKANKKFSAKVEFDFKENKLNLIFENNEMEDGFYDKDTYYQYKKDGVSYFLSKVTIGKTINKTDAKRLLEKGDSLFMDGFKSKKGSTFSANIKYNFKDKKIDLIFEDDNKENGFYEKTKVYEFIKDEEKYIIFKNSFGREIKKNEAEKLFDGKTLHLTGFKSKSGNSYDANIKYDFKNKKLELIFEDNQNEDKKDGFYEKNKLFELIQNGNSYLIWKNSFGREIKKNEAEKLFDGKTLHLTGFKSKSGNSYDANLSYSFKTKKLELSFDN